MASPPKSGTCRCKVSVMKHESSGPRWSWIFLAATVLALSSTLQAARMMSLRLNPPSSIPIGRLLALNFTLWWIPAALAPSIFRLVEWLFRTGASWVRSVVYHFAGLVLFSLIHFVAFFCVYATFWWVDDRLQKVAWLSSAQSIYLDNVNWTIATYGSIAILGYALNLRRRNHDRELHVAKLETELVEARLSALAGELQPEFLYGALDTVSNLVHVNPDRADRVISKLADFLRLVLNRTGVIVGPLQDELECVERYIEIEQLRLGTGVSMTLEIDPDTLDAEFPPMTLHSIVELLLDHPTGQQLTAAISIESSHDDTRLHVRISRAAGEPVASQTAQSRWTRRLAAIRERLRDLYGDRQEVGLSFDERASAVSISVPFRPVMVAE
jgi:two-component system, LytTR family, sensor kinase